MFKTLIVFLFSFGSFACALPEVELQKQVFTTLISEHSSGVKEDRVKTIRKIDFFVTNRVRFLYVSQSNKIKNMIQTYKVDSECKISLDPPLFK